MLKWSFFLFDKHTTKFFDDVEARGGKKLVLSTIFSSHHFRESKSKNNKILPPLYPGDISLISVESRKSLTKKNRSSIGWSSSSSSENVSFSHQNHFHEFVLSTFMSVRGNRKKSFPVHLQMKMTKCNSQSRDSISTKEKFHYALIWNEVLRLCKRLKSAFY
jgi:ABC-type molybdenum transport system ATPase subunit/photorepair protein PhrA